MGDSISPLMLKQVTKKGRVSINNRKCFISKFTSKDLPNPGEVTKKKFTELLISKIDRGTETIDGYGDSADFDNKRRY